MYGTQNIMVVSTLSTFFRVTEGRNCLFCALDGLFLLRSQVAKAVGVRGLREYFLSNQGGTQVGKPVNPLEEATAVSCKQSTPHDTDLCQAHWAKLT